jgi:LCP family protein required for cell wall assembly
MKRFITPDNARWAQLAGLVIAVIGLSGFWLSQDVERVSLTAEQRALVNPAGEDFHASFVVAGRDYDIDSYASPCEWVEDTCIREEVGTFRIGGRTDTILYVNIAGDELSLIAIPRDIWLPQWQTKINAMYSYQQADGLKRSVEEIIGVPIDYYAIVSIDIFEDLVDAVGGVEINIPYDMYYRDNAAGLLIDFDAGPAVLDGADAAKFVRYRNTRRSDYDRIDNVKRLAYALLARVKELNVRFVGSVPALVDSFLQDVETNASPALVRQMLPRLANLRIARTATLPTEEIVLESAGQVLTYHPDEVERFLATTLGGTARSFAEPPAATLLITNSSGQEGLERWYRERLITFGVPPERIITRTASFDPGPSRILTTGNHWRDADFYTTLLRTGKQQIDRLPVVDRHQADLEFVLGHDAAAVPGRNRSAALARAPRE